MATSYLTVAELALAVDTTLLAKLSADGGSTGTVNQSNTILVTAISRASASIDMAATVGNMYATADLDTLYNGGDWSIRSLCAGLTLGYLYARRGKTVPTSIQEQVDTAQRMLEELRDGRKVFAVEANRDAGAPNISIIPASVRVQLNLETSSPFYPRANTQGYG